MRTLNQKKLILDSTQTVISKTHLNYAANFTTINSVTLMQATRFTEPLKPKISIF